MLAFSKRNSWMFALRSHLYLSFHSSSFHPPRKLIVCMQFQFLSSTISFCFNLCRVFKLTPTKKKDPWTIQPTCLSVFFLIVPHFFPRFFPLRLSTTVPLLWYRSYQAGRSSFSSDILIRTQRFLFHSSISIAIFSFHQVLSYHS